MDDRFAHVSTDPRFRTLRKADKRVKVDKRFSKMFTEKKFKLKYSVDKRGKKTNKKSENFEKFYDLSDNESKQQKPKEEEESEDESEEEDEPKGIQKPNIPNARGVDTDEESDVSSSSDSEDSEGETEELIHEWNEWDKNVPKIEESTKRLAICNLDWDRITAKDLFVLANSFKPPNGSILSVKIYPSQLGLNRMKVEAESGPIQFIKAKRKTNTNNSDKDNEEVEEDIDDPDIIEELRQYELKRLQYYYAVVECDTDRTAEVLYNELDGMEYESSSTTFDLRFIGDDITFDGEVEPKSECSSMPDMVSYKAPQFINTALQQSKVQMTWDQTDPKRKDVFDRAFHKEDDDDLNAYLASSSDEDQQELDDIESDQEVGLSTKDKIDKYKNLLMSLEEPKEEKSEGDMEMEISWEPNLKDVAEDIVSKKKSHEKDISVFEENHSKKKEKRKQLKKQMEEEDQSGEDSEELVPKKSKKKSKDKTQPNDPNLELLAMDPNEESDKKHFNYKNIVENKTKHKSDSFKFNADDPRFSAVYTSHHYNVDPSDPHYKRTEAFEQIMNRTAKKMKNNDIEDTKRSDAKSEPSNSWSHLVRTVKNKSQSFANKRHNNFNVKQTKFKS